MKRVRERAVERVAPRALRLALASTAHRKRARSDAFHRGRVAQSQTIAAVALD